MTTSGTDERSRYVLIRNSSAKRQSNRYEDRPIFSTLPPLLFPGSQCLELVSVFLPYAFATADKRLKVPSTQPYFGNAIKPPISDTAARPVPDAQPFFGTPSSRQKLVPFVEIGTDWPAAVKCPERYVKIPTFIEKFQIDGKAFRGTFPLA